MQIERYEAFAHFRKIIKREIHTDKHKVFLYYYYFVKSTLTH